MKEGSAGGMTETAADAGTFGTATRAVIVADDEQDIRMLCRVNLEAAGFAVHEAAHADEVMDLAREIRPLHAILLDVSMPGRDGLECLSEIKSDPTLRDVPVVVLSGHVGDHERLEAERLGAARYVTKPFRPADLVALVQSLADPS